MNILLILPTSGRSQTLGINIRQHFCLRPVSVRDGPVNYSIASALRNCSGSSVQHKSASLVSRLASTPIITVAAITLYFFVFYSLFAPPAALLLVIICN